MLTLKDCNKAFHSSKNIFWECFTSPAYTDITIVFKDGQLSVNKACFVALGNDLKFCVEADHDLIILPDLSIHSFRDVLLPFTDPSIAGLGDLGPHCFSHKFHETLDYLGINLFKTTGNYKKGFTELESKMKIAKVNLENHYQRQESKSFYVDPKERTATSIFGINKGNSPLQAGPHENKERSKKSKQKSMRNSKVKIHRMCSQMLHDTSKVCEVLEYAGSMKEFLFCHVCTSEFVTSVDLETHMRKHHQYDGQIMTCTFCHCPCMGEEAVVVHEQILCKNKGNKCVYCEVKHPNRQALLDHMLEQHGKGEKKKCLICKTTFKVLKAKYAIGWPHINSCIDANALQMKKKLDFDGNKKAPLFDKCSQCGKELSSVKSAVEHFQKKSKCREEEKNHQIFSFILEVSHTNPHICDECGAIFKEEEWLKNHMLSIHRMQQEYFGCKQDSCNLKFATELALDLHTSSYHPDAKHECNICKCMIPKGDFKDHVISHAVQCKQCEKIFAHKGVLNNHILSVHDEKNRRIQKIKRKRFDEECSQQRAQNNSETSSHEDSPAPSERVTEESPSPMMSTMGQPSQAPITLVHPTIIGQHPYQQIIQVPVTHIQQLNVNQMTHFLQINNQQTRYQQ